VFNTVGKAVEDATRAEKVGSWLGRGGRGKRKLQELHPVVTREEAAPEEEKHLASKPRCGDTCLKRRGV